MDAFCPRCETTIADIPPENLAAGTCPSCGGPLSPPAPAPTDTPDDGGFGDSKTTVMSNPMGFSWQPPADLGATLAPAAAESAPEAPAPLLPEAAPASPPEPPVAAESSTPPEPVAMGHEGTPTVPGEGRRDTVEIPAHLQLPNFDFSLPPGVVGSVAEGGSAAPTPRAADNDSTSPGAPAFDSSLPAHLQLPNFPQFEMPASSGIVANEAAPAPSTAPAEEPNPFAPSESDRTTMMSPSMAAMMPPPPPRKKKADLVMAPAPAPAPASLPDLPSIGLPAVKPKKELTLLSSQAAAELAEAPEKKRPVVAIVLVLLAIGAAGGLFAARGKVVAALEKHQSPPPVELSAEDKARDFLLAGQAAYGRKEYEAAAKAFTTALATAPNYAKAHRGLAIAYASMKKEAEAVEHYRKYIELDPTASDAADVKKIVADYDKAKQKAAAAAAPTPVPEEAASKKKRK